MLKSFAKEKLAEIDLILKKAKANLKNMPEGHLKVSSYKGHVFYYQTVSDGKKVYISNKNEKLLSKLAQKDYDLNLIAALECQKSILLRFIKGFSPNAGQEVFCKLHPARKKLVEPFVRSVEQTVEEWKLVKYRGLPFYEDQNFYMTRKNEKVRSKSEVIIADTFDKYNVPYRYEFPLVIDSYGVVYPDFTVINPRTGKEFIFEHFGLIGNPDYEKTMNKKLVEYANQGFYVGENFLYTFETSNSPLNMVYLNQLIKHFLT